MIEELDDCFVKTAGNIIKYYGKISERLGRCYCISSLLYLPYFFTSCARVLSAKNIALKIKT